MPSWTTQTMGRCSRKCCLITEPVQALELTQNTFSQHQLRPADPRPSRSWFVNGDSRRVLLLIVHAVVNAGLDTSPHVHTISGSKGFSKTVADDASDLMNADCTSCGIVEVRPFLRCIWYELDTLSV